MIKNNAPKHLGTPNARTGFANPLRKTAAPEAGRHVAPRSKPPMAESRITEIEGAGVTSMEGGAHFVEHFSHAPELASAADVSGAVAEHGASVAEHGATLAEQGANAAEHGGALAEIAGNAVVHGVGEALGSAVPFVAGISAAYSLSKAHHHWKSTFDSSTPTTRRDVRFAVVHTVAAGLHTLSAAGIPGPGLAGYTLEVVNEKHAERSDRNRGAHAAPPPVFGGPKREKVKGYVPLHAKPKK
jgi:hypothetical protein